MTNDEITDMVRQSGNFSPTFEFLETFAKLVEVRTAAKEREACAKLCEEMKEEHGRHACAYAIRARGEA